MVIFNAVWLVVVCCRRRRPDDAAEDEAAITCTCCVETPAIEATFDCTVVMKEDCDVALELTRKSSTNVTDAAALFVAAPPPLPPLPPLLEDPPPALPVEVMEFPPSPPEEGHAAEGVQL
jgi:hypothetical protein